MRKTISSPGGVTSRQFILSSPSIRTNFQTVHAEKTFTLHGDQPDSILNHSPSEASSAISLNVNSKAVTRQVKLSSNDEESLGDNSTRSSSEDSGVLTPPARILEVPFIPEVTHTNTTPRLTYKVSLSNTMRNNDKGQNVRKRFANLLKFKRGTAGFDVDENTKLQLTQSNIEWELTDSPPDTEITTFSKNGFAISAPLKDFRHTAHLGHHGESFGDLSFLNSTQEQHKTSGLEYKPIEKSKMSIDSGQDSGRHTSKSETNSHIESSDCVPDSSVTSEEYETVQVRSIQTSTSTTDSLITDVTRDTGLGMGRVLKGYAGKEFISPPISSVGSTQVSSHYSRYHAAMNTKTDKLYKRERMDSALESSSISDSNSQSQDSDSQIHHQCINQIGDAYEASFVSPVPQGCDKTFSKMLSGRVPFVLDIGVGTLMEEVLSEYDRRVNYTNHVSSV